MCDNLYAVNNDEHFVLLEVATGRIQVHYLKRSCPRHRAGYANQVLLRLKTRSCVCVNELLVKKLAYP